MLVKALVGAAVALIVLGACVGAYKQGKKEGVQNYHDICYTIGGFIVDDKGTVVQCTPMGTIPKEELKGFISASFVH